MSGVAARPVVGIVLFDDVEVLDFAGPYEVLSAASYESGEACLKVLTVASKSQVTARGGLRVLVDATFDDCPALEVLIVPGGPGADNPTAEQEKIIPFLRERSAQARVVASVCTGAFILGRAGLLDGHRATTHSQILDPFRAEFPRVRVVEEKIVDESPILTAAGVSFGIDLALYLLAQWFGPDVRRRSAANLDGPWE